MKKKLLALFLALVMVGAVLPGCGDGSKDPGGQGNNGKTGEPVKGGEITVGIAQDLDSSLDPHKTVKAGTREVMFNVFEGLLKPDASGNLNPAVAESYTVSEDHLLYTFKLRAGVKFHNGQEVTPEDVIWSYQRCGDANAPADTSGAQVYRGQLLCEVADLGTLELSVELDELDLNSVRVGDTLTYTLDAYGDEIFSGTVTKIYSIGTAKQNATYFDVRVTLPTGKTLLPGMNGTVILSK